MRKRLYLLPVIGLSILFSGCLGEDQNEKNSAWRNANEKYVEEMAALTENGVPVYTRIESSWIPGSYILMRWHNDRSKNPNVVTPLYNSTVDVIYDMYLCDGTAIQNSFDLKTNGDSIYQTTPAKNIDGFAQALNQMVEGDTCTVIIPANMAYGNIANGSIPAYSALVYGLKLKKIRNYESASSAK